MEIRISATDLARKVGEILGKVRFRRDTFVIERNGEPVARLIPTAIGSGTALAEGLRAWRQAASDDDPGFVDVLERVNRADRVPEDPGA